MALTVEKRSLANGPQEGVKYPMKVQYCGECSLPIEYCEYYPNAAKCNEWLEKNLPQLFQSLSSDSKDGATNSTPSSSTVASGGGESNAHESDNNDSSANVSATVGEKKGRQKRGGKALVKTKRKDNVERFVKIARSNRGKKKYVTVINGLSTYEIDLKDAAKLFASKFACGSSVTGSDEIVIQGDVKDELFDLITDKWPEIDEDTIEDLGDVKK